MAILGHQQKTPVSRSTSPHLLEAEKGLRVNVNVAVVDVVSQQPLK